MNLEDVDFEAEWERLRKFFGHNMFSSLSDDPDIVLMDHRKRFIMNHQVFKVFEELGLVKLNFNYRTSSVFAVNVHKYRIDFQHLTWWDKIGRILNMNIFELTSIIGSR